MNETSTEALAVVVEREMPHPAERIWRALTQSQLIDEWLAKSDFEPVVGHRFSLKMTPQPNQTIVVDGEVLVVEPNRRLTYTWNATVGGAGDLRSSVTWTLTPSDGGTRLRLEHIGFRPDQPLFYHGARGGWPHLIAALERVLARVD